MQLLPSVTREFGEIPYSKLQKYKAEKGITDSYIKKLKNISSNTKEDMSELFGKSISSRQCYHIKEVGIIYAAIFGICDLELACIANDSGKFKHYFKMVMKNEDFMNSLTQDEKSTMNFFNDAWENLDRGR